MRVNFLPGGHTHEDIDAFFGVFSKFLDKLDVFTIEGTCRKLILPLILVKTIHACTLNFFSYKLIPAVS